MPGAGREEFVLSRAYEERVYAGVLGKIIGVYLGRPFEGWSNEQIERDLGEIHYYVHERRGAPLIVTDDDISGTFAFLRALPENGNDPDLPAAQIGDWWLNTIIEDRTILWWGGLGVSTEHTAYLRLKAGIRAPESGSIATNGRLVAEQIGAQIFIDGWGMVCPGDPERAAEMARRAASVSHDGEAVYGAQVVAALIAQAFQAPSLDVMLDTAARLIPENSVISRLIGDIRGWAAAHSDDWRATFRRIQQHYGYDRYGGGCHMVPNHAIILLALLHGDGDFGRSLTIANTAGWDTDCNSGNVGCILGIRNGLAAFAGGADWRGPVADRMFLPTADGGRAITDALREAYEIVNIGRALSGYDPAHPKAGARFHFSLPGSVQGFRAEAAAGVPGPVSLENAAGRLEITLHQSGAGQSVRIATATFVPPDSLAMTGYGLIASPTLYSGQRVTAVLEAATDTPGPIEARLFVRSYGHQDAPEIHRGPAEPLQGGQSRRLHWTVPDLDGRPILEVGVELTSAAETGGRVFLDFLTWGGVPDLTLGRPDAHGAAWLRAWVDGADRFSAEWPTPALVYRVIQNHGTGLVTQGEAAWAGYTVSTEVLPHLVRRAGLVAAVRGLRRYVALVLDSDGQIRLVEQRDGDRRTLAELAASWRYEQPVLLSITVTEAGIMARAGDKAATASGNALPARGAVGMLVEEGYAEFGPVRVTPAS